MALLKSVLPWVLIIAIKLYVLWASVNLINMDELSPWKLGESSTHWVFERSVGGSKITLRQIGGLALAMS